MLKKVLSCVALSLLIACQPRVNSRGNVTVTQNFDKFVAGTTTMEDVISACGTPSLNKDGLTWYYIGAKSQEIAFRKVMMTDRCVVKMQFDKNRVLRSIKRIPLCNTNILPTEEGVTDLIDDKQASQQAQSMLKGGR